jgi:peptide/nickel transport system ATP-binding protein/oligopeptide transport system ATP-binding protein
MALAPLLSVRDLRVWFKQGAETIKAVDGPSFEVRSGETVCLVGESGCGKTLSALSVLGLVPESTGRTVSGAIEFQGRDLLELGEEELLAIRGKHIGMVFQDPLSSLNPVFTIQDQIQEAVAAHEKRSPKELKKRCIDSLREVGLPSPESRLGSYPHQLSGGQRQRVMIAMATILRPGLVIADEPTTALDVTVQAQILRLFQSLQQELGMAVLYITHDLSVVANVADRVYVMYAGVIVEHGPVGRLFENPGHPYTRGLLASLPAPGRRGERLTSIPGSVPDPAHKPRGCPFHPRCGHAVSRCAEEFPEMVRSGPDHQSRCPVINA